MNAMADPLSDYIVIIRLEILRDAVDVLSAVRWRCPPCSTWFASSRSEPCMCPPLPRRATAVPPPLALPRYHNAASPLQNLDAACPPLGNSDVPIPPLHDLDATSPPLHI